MRSRSMSTDHRTGLDHAVFRSGLTYHPDLFDGDRWRRERDFLREVGPQRDNILISSK